MGCEKFKELLAGYQDGELDAEQKAQLEKHLAECADCRQDLARLNKVKEVTEKVTYNDLPLEVWDGYWQGIYKRLERGLGWIFLSIGAIILLVLGAYHLTHEFFMDATVSPLSKVGVAGLILGLIFLLVSVGRERIFAYKHDRYREVQR